MNRPDLQQPPLRPRRQVSAPPRLVLWLVLGLFLLAVVGAVAGVVIFRNVLLPSQQERVVNAFPFMAVFQYRIDPDATLPTAVAPDTGIDPMSLLEAPVANEDDGRAEEEQPAAPALPTPTEISLLPTETPPPTSTPTPEPTALPTQLPSVEPTTEPLSQTVVSLSGAGIAQAGNAAEQEPAAAQSAAQEAPEMSRPRQEHLSGFTWDLQTWNNCGPANITMALSYYGWNEDQAYAAQFVRPHREDKNVSPHEMVSFVNEQSGIRAITRMGGDMELLKQLIAARFPVVIETGSTAFEGYDWIGHYRTVVGYDDNAQQFYIYDTYLGTGENEAGLPVSYGDFDEQWKAFNRVFIVLYTRDRESEVAQILGPLADVTASAEHALEVARQEARQNPQDRFAWFNMGTALTKLGRYEEAATAFDQAMRVGLHFRMLWYQFGPFEAYFNVGRYDDVLAYVNNNLSNGGEYVEETYYWQGRVFAARGRVQEARQSFQQALQHNPRFTLAQEALAQLNA